MIKIKEAPDQGRMLPSDKALIEGIAKKDLSAYRQLVCKYYDFVYLITFAFFNSNEKANEYIVSIMLYVWDAGSSIERNCDLKEYLLDLIRMNYRRDIVKLQA